MNAALSQSDLQPDVIVVGGGAAGFFGAIACAENAPGLRVLLLEQGRQLLTKVRVSGGGRCNLTHACFDPAFLVKNYPRGGSALRGPFTRFQPRDTVEWFSSRGVPLKTEEDGRIFPVSDSSESVVQCLTREAAHAGVLVRTEVDIESIALSGADGTPGFHVTLVGGEKRFCRRVLLATGSGRRAYRWAQSLGHRIVPPVPSLFTFAVPNDPRLKGMAGISVPNARIAVQGTSLARTGPVLITHWGLSGPAVLTLSAWGARTFFEAGYKARLEVRWCAGNDFNKTTGELRALKAEVPRRLVIAHASFGLPQRLWERLVAASGLAAGRRWADVSAKELDALARELSAGVYRMEGKGAFKEEFVT
ncbi:MAG: aminoacetone oxidase family FAD-binding enzyme, partial [Elusimicrobia bacterium]|nr:aminoacetone oxidase family FAD-binding enzyme [Elusimicrobiota bacterium]